MKLSRQIGQTSQILNLFAQDTSVSTGAGLANIPATTVSYTWFHNNQTAVSTGVAVSTASVGAYTSGAWTQISSSLALGWYQFGLPDGALAAGDAVGVHIYVSTGAFAMAPLPIEIELTRVNNQQFASSTVFLAHTSTSPAEIRQALGQPIVTSGAGILNVSTQSLVGITVSTQSLVGITVSTQSLVGITTAANLIQAYGSAIVTSASGQLLVSTQAIDKGGYGVTTVSAAVTTNANVIQAYGSAIVTSASGQFRVSTQSLVGIVVSTQTIDKTGYDVTSFYAQPAVTSGAGILNVSTQALSAGSGNITQVYGQAIVTTGSGIILVSTQSLVGIVVSTQAIDKTGYALTAAYDPAKTASQAGDAMTLTVGERGTLAGVMLSTTQAESFRTSSATASITQLMYEMVANLTEAANSGTTRAVGSVTSHVAKLTYQYDNSSAPASVTRIG